MMWWLDTADLVFGLFVGVWLTQNYFMPVLPVKVTTIPAPKAPIRFTKWSELLEPNVRKLRLAGTFNMAYTYNPKGALALASLLEEIGGRMDAAVELNLMTEKENANVG